MKDCKQTIRMADRVSELFKTSLKLTSLVYILLLLICNLMTSMYVMAVLVPLIYVAIYKFSLPPAEEWIADEMLGPPVTTDPNLCRPSMIIAHRTCALEAPENTIAGIKKAKEDGAMAVEMDVRFTKDDIAVLLHDDTIDRTTNGVGCLSDLTYEEIKHLDASINHLYHNKYKGEPIPTLEEAIQECVNLELRMFIEMKDVDDRAIGLLTDIYQRYPVLYEIAVIVSFYPLFLYQLRRNDPNMLTVLVWRPYVMALETTTGLLEDGHPRYGNKPQQVLAGILDVMLEWAIHHVLWHICGVSGMLIHKAVMSPRYLSHWSRLKMRVLVWTVNSAREKDYLTNVLHLSYMTDTVKRNVLMPNQTTTYATHNHILLRNTGKSEPAVVGSYPNIDESAA